jgi:hypothetical protein
MKTRLKSPANTGKVTLVAKGRCTLVGAGPGDPELLTLKAVKAIQAATVLLVDDLVKTTPPKQPASFTWANAVAANPRPRPSLKNSW